jgi:hypothetical protein
MAGGAALTIREISGRPIKFTGVGEKMEALEPFYPERMANRILGMGDVLSFVEKAQDSIQVSALSLSTPPVSLLQTWVTPFSSIRHLRGAPIQCPRFDPR